MRLRDLQQMSRKFTNGQKGTMISDCPDMESMSGHLEDVRRIEIQESNTLESCKISIKTKIGMNYLDQNI